MQGSGEKGQRRQGGALPSPHLAGKGSRVGREEGPVILFVGFCCHPVGIYLYWLLPAASSQCGTTWIGEGPLPFFPPSLPQQQEGPADASLVSLCVSARCPPFHVKSPIPALEAQATLGLNTTWGLGILVPDSTWGGTFTVPAVQTRKPLQICLESAACAQLWRTLVTSQGI